MEGKQENAKIKKASWEDTGTSFELARNWFRFRGHFINKTRKVINACAQIRPPAWIWAETYNGNPGRNQPGWNPDNQPTEEFGQEDTIDTETTFTGTKQSTPTCRWCNIMEYITN